MTVRRSTEYTIWCDVRGCGELYDAYPSMTDVRLVGGPTWSRRWARQLGWTFGRKDGKDRCPRHSPDAPRSDDGSPE